MCSFYRNFVPNFAAIAEPLTRLTRKNVTFKWEREQELSFKKIKQELEKNATLSHFGHKLPTALKTDASGKGIAGILLQRRNDEWKIVACCSRRISSAEENYGSSDKEGLAVVYSMQKFRNYLLGISFTLLTDNCALCALKLKSPTSKRLERWALILSEFDYDVKYVSGKTHHDADCLSRAPVDD